MNTSTTAADLLVAELKDRQVPFVASLNGHGLDPFYLACQRADLRVIDVRNEQAAGYMAEVTGRLTRSVGVCAVSGGVAHANALTGVLNAWFDGAPMLLVTGITPHSRMDIGDFQDFNPVPMAEPICKYARLIDSPERVCQIVHEAFTAATTGRPGPVHLALPLDVAASPVDESQVLKSRVRKGCLKVTGAATNGEITAVIGLLKQARRPVIVAGSGVYYSRGEQALSRFSLQQEIPVVIPIWDRGSVPEPMETFMGVIGAASGEAEILGDADLILLLGTEFDYRIRQLSPPGIADSARTVRVHADSGRLGQGLAADLEILASPATFLDQLAQTCQESGCPPVSSWLEKVRERRADHRATCLQAASRLPAGINGRQVVDTILSEIHDDSILLVDGGNIGQWFHQLIDRYPGHYVTCGASGVVGFGLPGAMAASALYSDRKILLLSGDGSFTFTIAELECAARQGLRFVAVVADDEEWGISVTGHVESYGRPLFSKLGPSRLDRVAEGFGCRGIRIEEIGQLGPAIRDGFAAGTPTVIHVPIVPGNPKLSAEDG